MLFLKFANSPKKTKGYTKQRLSYLDLKEMNNYIKETSYNKTKLKFNIDYSWHTLPNNSYDYGTQGNMSEEQENSYMNSIYNLTTENIDFSKSDAIWVYTDPDLGFYYTAFRNSLVADGKKMMMYMYNEGSHYGSAHELLYTMGLRDLYSTISIWGVDGGMTQFSIMAQAAGGTNILGIEKYSLGWLSGSDVICQESGSQTVKLNSLDSAKGTKLILVPLNAQEMLGIEYRKKEKRDRYLGGSGILVYHLNTNFNEASPINPLFFGNKGNVDFKGVKINIKKNVVTVTR